MATFDDLQTVNDALIRKGLQGSVFMKPWVSGDPEITTLKDATGLLALPTGYEDVGRITKGDGVSWIRDISTSDTESLGAAQPTRRDITSDVSGLQFTAQESNLVTLGLHEGLSLTGETYDANGNVSWDKPDRPATLYYRAFVLFKDGEGTDAYYFAKWVPRCQVTDRSEQAWNEGTEKQYGITMTAFVDAAVGTAVRTLWASSTANLTAMGFTAAV
jgi:hypothetical protein